MFQNEIDTLEILIDSYQNITSENNILLENLNEFINDSKNINLLINDDNIVRSCNMKIQNVINSLISIQENTLITNNYGQTDKPFNFLNQANDYIKINYSQISNINNLKALKLLPVCKLSSFKIKKIQKDDFNFYEISFNKLDRLKPYEVYQALIPIYNKSDYLAESIKFSNQAIEDLERINYLIELNIKKINLGIKHIDQIAKIPI